MKWFVSLSSLLLIVTHAHANAWNSAMIAAGETWNQNTVLFSDPYSSTVWGTLKQQTVDLSDQDQIDNTVFLRTPYYQKASGAFLLTQKQGNSPFNKNAPLIVILPGIFKSAFDGNELANAEDFYRQGYHVLLLSNPWSLDAIGNNPSMKPGDIVNEGKWVLAAIQQLISTRDLSAQYISSISIYGESYGSFLGSVVAGLDDPTHPLITGKVMLASPPISMTSALQKLDSIVDETAAIEGECAANKLKIGLSFLKADSQASLSPSSVQCSEWLVANSFNHSLYQSILAIQKTSLQVPEGPFQTRFQYYLDHFVPEESAMCATTSKCTLGFWIAQAETNGKNDIQIVAAKDDFLNVGQNWDQIAQLLANPPDQLILLDWGGHLGYTASTLYTEAVFTN
jgi:hypothetical protein